MRLTKRPIEALAAVLELPDLSPHERDLVAPRGIPSELFPDGVGYLGWPRAFFVAGD